MGRTTFQKLHKERKRKEKQVMKTQKRADRKLAKTEASAAQPEKTRDEVESAPEPDIVTTF